MYVHIYTHADRQARMRARARAPTHWSAHTERFKITSWMWGNKNAEVRHSVRKLEQSFK